MEHSSRNSIRKATPIFLDGRCVGRVLGDVFRKTVEGSRHMLRKPPAWAVSVEALDMAEANGAKTVEIVDTETGKTYRVSCADFRAHGRHFNRGHGDQLLLTLRFFSVDGQQAEVMPSSVTETASEQLALLFVP